MRLETRIRNLEQRIGTPNDMNWINVLALATVRLFSQFSEFMGGRPEVIEALREAVGRPLDTCRPKIREASRDLYGAIAAILDGREPIGRAIVRYKRADATGLTVELLTRMDKCVPGTGEEFGRFVKERFESGEWKSPVPGNRWGF